MFIIFAILYFICFQSIPWSYRVKSDDGFVLRDKMGEEVWEGYCIDFLKRLANVMNFDYELIPNESFGVREPNGVWTGLVGDLATGVSIGTGVIFVY